MNSTEFGKEIKKRREHLGLRSMPLAEKIGRGKAYVSQLETGAIKNPDYNTCFKLLKELSFPLEKIEDYLYSFGIISERRKKFELESSINRDKSNEQALNDSDEEYIKYHYPWLYNDEALISNLKRKNDYLSYVFNNIIETDFSRADAVLTNINNLTKSKASFDFFCSLFQYDFFSITTEQRNELIKIIETVNLDKNSIFDYKGE
ncbi:helix-turn-helix domain-containing protein [Bacillus sp. S/N-304-OC-R1]|uniref:helix-turn-helix domain-containing protein n=1 Tax=Bacillus sp. S/N-304-OC-R1 TaxID=2758034 RepID=UPI001C8E6BBF|nr:helix-turn-helix transcriptional regulator [Bacillus sp. S/N-304-OC-R1]MBY0123619.1 helix-turn-helix transcriptional regulator [Bacillus sp. S/N-304-OC-R1]